MIPPHDLEVERELLGSLTLNPHAIEDVLVVTGPDDCYSPANAAAFAAIVALHRRGDDPTDLRAVIAEAATQGIRLDPADVATWPGTFRWRTAAERLAELRLRRDLLAVALVATEAAEGVPDPDVVRARLDLVGPVASTIPDTLVLSADFVEQDIEAAPWVIPGLLRRQDRAVIVGFEGHGKSTLLAQMSWCATAGLHPFTRKPIDPITALYIDCENRDRRVQDGYRPLIERCKQFGRFDRTRHFTWKRAEGIDIRSRRDHAELEAILRSMRPDLVCIGPLRKTYRRRAQENDEASSLDVQWHFDHLIGRYGFALIAEHHAPHGSGYSARTARPFGSSTWLGWPEFGYGMTPDEKRNGVYSMDGWREDRTAAEWPHELHRGDVWPWDGYRTDGWTSYTNRQLVSVGEAS